LQGKGETDFRNCVSATFHSKRVNSGKYGRMVADRPAQSPLCPNCRSPRIWKDGLRKNPSGAVQRWICRDCGYRFSEQTSSNDKKGSPHTLKYQVCADEKEAKNLVVLETRHQKQDAGATTELDVTIDQFKAYLTKKQLTESTVRTYVSIMRFLVKLGADIFKPDDVNLVMGQQDWSDGRKNNVIKAYTHFARLWDLEQQWDRPKMKPQQGLPRPPSTEQVIALTSGASRKYSVIFKFMAQTGAIAMEVSIMTERSFDFERNQVFIKGCKGHKDRWVPMYLFGSELPGLMQEFLNRYRGFPKNTTILGKFRKYRDRTAKKTGDKPLMNVRCEDIRHWFATEYYKRYRDPFLLQDYMGHEKFETTRIYTKLVPSERPSYVTRPVLTVEEGLKLGEQGWEKYDEINGVHLYRRPKTFEELAPEKGSWSSERGPWSSLV